jgi:putative phosphoesterase
MVRIGAVSDVHGNVPALRAALDALDGQIDELWCAGDIVHEYRFCTETVELLRDAGAVAIQGNHDMVLLSPAGAGARERPGVEAAALEWLGSLPYQHDVDLAGVRVRMVHGSPWEPYGDYLRAHNPKWQQVADLDVDILIAGHTHEPMVERFGDTLVVNPGSLGEPRQHHDRRGTFAVVDTAARVAEIHRVDI